MSDILVFFRFWFVKFVKLLPPAYVVQREGNSFTLFVSAHLGGVPISHNALQHFPKCHGADGGVPCQVQPGGVPCWGGTHGGVPCRGGLPCWGGGTLLGQQKEYSLHCGRYASCVHTGGLSCFKYGSSFLTSTGMNYVPVSI